MKDIRIKVKKTYSNIARNKTSCCSGNCSCQNSVMPVKEADLGLSC